MDFTANNLWNFVYIIVIILGGVTLTLTLILYAKEKNVRHRAMLYFVASIFIYMTTDFITYYLLGENVSGQVVFAFITASDVLFCILVAAWTYLIIVLSGLSDHINIKPALILSAVYLVSSQILSVSLGRYDSYLLHVQNGVGKMILQGLNFLYAAFFIAIGIKCIILICRKYRNAGTRNATILIILIFIGYMVWVMYWDYSTWYKNEENMLEIYTMDPLILMYAILSGYLIYYFYKKDPLHIYEVSMTPEDAVTLVSQRYDLSQRENEVLALLNRGMSNRQIADALFISENTVKRHINSILRKTETKSRNELIVKILNINK